VNMMLLATYMKRNNWDFDKGENGLLAVQAVQARATGFDVIFMGIVFYILVQPPLTQTTIDVSMPIMTGYQATTAIRKIEGERRAAGLDFQPALIIALTGFSSEKDQEEAFEAGVDIFMTKPVRFREVGRVLEGWKKSAFPDEPEIR
jgi:CheY-like chemotaxis protein